MELWSRGHGYRPECARLLENVYQSCFISNEQFWTVLNESIARRASTIQSPAQSTNSQFTLETESQETRVETNVMSTLSSTSSSRGRSWKKARETFKRAFSRF